MVKNGCPFCNPLTRIIKENDTAQVILSDPRKVVDNPPLCSKRFKSLTKAAA